MKLHLGVIEQNYSDASEAERYHHAMKKALGEGYSRHMTTGDVATILEARYHVMDHFMQLHGQEVADDMANGIAGALESMMMGAPATLDPFGTAMSATEERFKAMLSSKELDSLGYPGIPTKAAKRGVNPRFKGGRGPKNRPSFVASGLYQSSFKAWVDGAPQGDR